MCKFNVIEKLKNLGFSVKAIEKLSVFRENLLIYNKKHNFIAKSTENDIWRRHILDCAQIIRFFDNKVHDISDFGSGAGFPGLILSIFDEKNKFHVKLYEKSPIKRDFLRFISDKIGLNIEIKGNVYEETINTDLIVCRAFKKLDEIIKISREIVKTPHNLIILKGKNAQLEINNVSLGKNYRYKLEDSITEDDSKIIMIEAKK